jgi:plasmid stabilization system protein ParE
MIRRFVLRPRAEDDVRSAFEWYASQRAELGDAFLAAVREKLEVIRSFPESNPVIYRNVRRGIVSKFPYYAFYVVRPTEISVLAVLHHARNPAFWPRR